MSGTATLTRTKSSGGAGVGIITLDHAPVNSLSSTVVLALIDCVLEVPFCQPLVFYLFSLTSLFSRQEMTPPSLLSSSVVPLALFVLGQIFLSFPRKEPLKKGLLMEWRLVILVPFF